MTSRAATVPKELSGRVFGLKFMVGSSERGWAGLAASWSRARGAGRPCTSDLQRVVGASPDDGSMSGVRTVSEGLASVIRRASAAHGIVSRDEVRDLGVSDARRRRLISSGILVEVVPGIYVLGASHIDWATKLRVAVRQAAPSGAAGFSSAAAWWEMPGFQEGPIEIVMSRSVSPPRSPLGTIHRISRWVPGDIVEQGDLRVTSPVRTLADIASEVDAPTLDRCVQDLARRGLVTIERMARHLERRRARGCSGVRSFEEAIERHATSLKMESFLESEFLVLLDRCGFPTPEVQVEIRVGSERYRVDCLYPKHDLVIELKGHGTHSTRAQLNRDADREAALLAVGLRVLTFTYDQVIHQPDQVVRRLRAVLVSNDSRDD